MADRGMKINVVTYNAAISALAKAARNNVRQSIGDDSTGIDEQQLWKRAMSLIYRMKKERIWPDLYSYSAAISACGSGGEYQEALALLKTMKFGPAKLRPNRVAYTGAICKIFVCYFVAKLVLRLNLIVLFADISTIAACAKAGEWSHALELFVNMQTDRIKADVVAWNALISAFMNGGKPDMVS